MPDIVQLVKERRSALREFGKTETAVKALGSVRVGGKRNFASRSSARRVWRGFRRPTEAVGEDQSGEGGDDN